MKKKSKEQKKKNPERSLLTCTIVVGTSLPAIIFVVAGFAAVDVERK